MSEIEPHVRWNAGYRLPTEAEWEKAARGGKNGHRFPWADAETITHRQANYVSNGTEYDVSPTKGWHPEYGRQPSPVADFPPNGYGLYDMAGNVPEYCWDWHGAYAGQPVTDPRGPPSGI